MGRSRRWNLLQDYRGDMIGIYKFNIRGWSYFEPSVDSGLPEAANPLSIN